MPFNESMLLTSSSDLDLEDSRDDSAALELLRRRHTVDHNALAHCKHKQHTVT